MSNSKYDAQARNQSIETTLDLLDAVATDESVSQRQIASRLGVALGLTNAILKRCVRKGLLKISQVPARRYKYYLTPTGFAEKSKLTAEYLSASLQFYRSARQDFSEVFAYCAVRGWKRLALVSTSELAEIATLVAREMGIEVIGIVDPERNEPAFCGLRVFRDLKELAAVEKPAAVVVSDIVNPQATYDVLCGALPKDRVLAPKLLRVVAGRNGAGDVDGDPGQ